MWNAEEEKRTMNRMLQLKDIVKDTKTLYVGSNEALVFIGDLIGDALADTLIRKETAIQLTNNGTYYLKLQAEIECLKEILDGTIYNPEYEIKKEPPGTKVRYQL